MQPFSLCFISSCASRFTPPGRSTSPRNSCGPSFLQPWVAGQTIDWSGRKWAPDRAKLAVYQGPELRPDEIGMGRGWANAARSGEEVTARVLAEQDQIARGGQPLQALKLDRGGAVRRGAADPVQCCLRAAERWPQLRASECLALAEQAVWELLHERRVSLVSDRAGVHAPVGEDQLAPRAARLGELERRRGGRAGRGRRRSGRRPTATRRPALGHHVGDHAVPLALAGEQIAMDPQQAFDVMDIVVEVGDQQQRPAAELLTQASARFAHHAGPARGSRRSSASRGQRAPGPGSRPARTRRLRARCHPSMS